MKTADVEEEYKRNKELSKDDINTLQEWAKKQPHLPEISELQFILFLQSCYWSLEHTKSTIDKFFTYRSAWTDIFQNRNPANPRIRNAMDAAMMPQNYRVLFGMVIDPDVSKYVFKDVVKVFDMCISTELVENGTSDGLVIIIDVQKFTVGHVLKTNPMEMKKLLVYLQNALPVRLKALYYVNVKSVAELLIPLVKPFIKPELLDSLLFMESYEKLFEVVPKECFPKDFGGNSGTIIEHWGNMRKRLLERADYFVEEEDFISNEARRDRRPSYMDKDFGIGIDGSFKKLGLD